jgi:hypothetical protein
MSRRYEGLDIARGILLAAMLGVHVLSAHGTASQVNLLHGWVGVFLISSGFVGLSGYVIGLRARGLGGAELLRGTDRGLQLVLVMFGYGVLLSLLRHGLALLGDGAAACAAERGWTAPLRFDDLGILLPIAIVQVLGVLAGARPRWIIPALAALAIGWMILPALTADTEGGVLLDVLTRRTLTPFYTVTTFVAIGLVGVALGRARPRWLLEPSGGPAARLVAVALAIALAMPPVGRAVLDPVYRASGALAGDLSTLGYWAAVLCLFLAPFSPAGAQPRGPLGRAMALLGRNSLFVFVLHDLLLVLDAAVRTWLEIDKSGPVVVSMILVNLAILLAAARGLEGSARARAWVDGILLGRARAGSLVGGGAFSLPGALALAGILAVYTSSALAGPDRQMLVDDFESATCPRWWTFGFVPQTRAPADPGAQGAHVLEVRGPAPGSFAHGRGLFLEQDVGDRRRLLMLVRGEGPGSGRIKIELSEDDNGNWEIEKEPPLYIPIHDDRFVYELSVDWRGWREVNIPFDAFRDDNPHGGNNVFDPARDMTSGGLLEIQLLFAPSGLLGDEVRLAIDNIRFAP